MTATVHVRNRQRWAPIQARFVGTLARAILDQLAPERSGGLGVYLVGRPEIIRLNETFLRHAGPTDVIAFDYLADTRRGARPPRRHGAQPDTALERRPPARREAPIPFKRAGSEIGAPSAQGVHGAMSSRACLHAEIFICVEEAMAQARRYRASWPEEVVRCLIHGVLHLSGYDDTRAGPRRKMKRVENRLLKEIGKRFPWNRTALRPRVAADVRRRKPS